MLSAPTCWEQLDKEHVHSQHVSYREFEWNESDEFLPVIFHSWNLY